MKSSDLPTDVKHDLLDRIRNQVGPDEYRKLVKQVGENGLVDLALQGMEQAARESKGDSGSDRSGGLAEKLWGKAGWLLGLVVLLWGGSRRIDSAVGLGILILAAWIVPRVRGWVSRTFPP